MANLSPTKVAQEKRTLEVTLSSLQEARLLLGHNTRFIQLAKLIDSSITEAQCELYGAEEVLESNR